jgi:hypothetical protein
MHGTTRDLPERGIRGGVMIDGWGKWAGLALLSSVVSFALLAIVAVAVVERYVDEPRLRRLVMVALFVSGALLGSTGTATGRYWWQLIQEQSRADYVVSIAAGLPLATFGSLVGLVSAMTLGAALLRHYGRSAHET